MDLVQQGGYEYDEFNDEYEKYAKGMLRSDGTPGFATPSGRIELISPTFQAWGIDPWPKHYESVAQSMWTTDEEYRKEYPFTIINGNRSYEFFHSENRQQKTMREFHPVPYVQVSKQTAEEYGLSLIHISFRGTKRSISSRTGSRPISTRLVLAGSPLW